MQPPYRKIGILREAKVPPDRRTPLTPAQCAEGAKAGLDITVQRSPVRAFTDEEYLAAGVRVVEDMTDRDLLIGVKEVPVNLLMAGKSYLFFSHTIKRQPHNQKLLHTVLERGITLIDHELLTDPSGARVIAFGKWAGVVGTYNAFRALHIAEGAPDLKPAHQCHDRQEMEAQLATVKLRDDLRIVLTGGGRVGGGAMEVLDHKGLRQVTPDAFLNANHDGPVYTVLGSADLYERTDGAAFDKSAFHHDPSGHRSRFLPYARRAQLYIACHFWDPRGPKILSRTDLRDPRIALRAIADISCDVGGPIDSTIRSTTISDPFFGYDPETATECPVGRAGSITVMAVDNLPCELPRDASLTFGRDLLEKVLPHLSTDDWEGMIARATIASEGRLTEPYAYLSDYANTVI
jgi:alanine dehydrogenase